MEENIFDIEQFEKVIQTLLKFEYYLENGDEKNSHMVKLKLYKYGSSSEEDSSDYLIFKLKEIDENKPS